MDTEFVMGPAISSAPIESIDWVEFMEGDREWAGLPGLKFRSFELVSGDLKRYKGIFLDSTSVCPEWRRVNHLSSDSAIKLMAERSRRVTHLRNSLNRLRERDSDKSEFNFPMRFSGLP